MKEKRLFCAGEQTHAEIKIKNCIAGFTPLILGATAGHLEVVEILLDHGADIEAQSERTKDTPLSLACSGGRYEVGFVRVSLWLDVFDLCVSAHWWLVLLRGRYKVGLSQSAYLCGHVRSGGLCALVVIVLEVEVNMAGFDRVRLCGCD